MPCHLGKKTYTCSLPRIKNPHNSPVQAGPVRIERESNVDGLGPIKYEGPVQGGPVGIECESNGGSLGSAKHVGTYMSFKNYLPNEYCQSIGAFFRISPPI